MAAEPLRDFEGALRTLEQALARGSVPDRTLARSVLVPLGRLVLASPGPEVEAARSRLEAAVRPVRKVWEQAVEDEIRLACAEHCMAVDPRHLERPGYDFGYTIQARERLEARLAAAEALGLPARRDLREAVQRADAVLAPFLADPEEGGATPRDP